MLKVGDIVIWSGSWGRDIPEETKVIGIEINCVDKEGDNVQEVSWSEVNSRSVIVNLNNGHWAYGTQIRRKL